MPTSQPLKNILIIEDNLAHIRLIQEAFKLNQRPYELAVARDGVEAIDYLRQTDPHTDAPRPDIILLDLNLPRKDGRQVLAEVKADPSLKCIPIVVLSNSDHQEDINVSYALHANCYIRKSRNFQGLSSVIQQIEEFWLRTAMLATE